MSNETTTSSAASDSLRLPVERVAAPSSAVPVQVGELIGGKYRIEKILGAGGMGFVAAAEHVQLHGRVALKFLLPHLEANHEFASRFVREAQASARLQNEHVVRVLDTSVHDGHPYLVMECLEGCNLDDLLEVRGRLGVEEAVTYVLEAMEAVAEAHAAGIVHRDLKLSNLFLMHRPDGSRSIKVLDFGISKSLDLGPDDGKLTRSNNMLGSPVYMSPEQVRSARQVDVRSDVWSLGIILHELVAGTPPFLGDTMSATLASVVADDPPALHTVRADAPPALSQVILRCLAKKPEGRFADVAALAAALAPWADPDAQRSIARITHLALHVQRTSGSSPSAPPVASAEFARQSASNRPMTTSVSQMLAAPAHSARTTRWWPIAVGAATVALGASFLMHRASTSSDGPLAADRPAQAAAAPVVAAAVPVQASTSTTALPSRPEPSVAPVEAGVVTAAVASSSPTPVAATAVRPAGGVARRGATAVAAVAKAEPAAAPSSKAADAPAEPAPAVTRPRDMGAYFEDRR